MSTIPQNWSLYNRKTDIQIDGLKLSQAKSIVGNLRDADLIDWKAWHEGLSEWHSLTKFSELMQSQGVGSLSETLVVDALKSKPKPERSKAKKVDNPERGGVTFEMDDDDLEKSRIMIVEGKNKEARLNSRFTRSYEAKVQVDGITISCHTLDISMGGMRLDRKLPTTSSQAAINCELSWGNRKLLLACIAIPDPNSKGSSRLIIKKLKDPHALRSWLLEGS